MLLTKEPVRFLFYGDTNKTLYTVGERTVGAIPLETPREMFRFAQNPKNFVLDEPNMMMYVVNQAYQLNGYKMFHEGADRAPWEVYLGQTDSVIAVTRSRKIVTATSSKLVFARICEDGSVEKE